MKVLKPEESLVMQFKNAGYDTLGTGKIWHGGLAWKEQWTATQEETFKKGEIRDRSIGSLSFGPIVEGGDEAVSDTGIADYGISELGKTHAKPFFLALGFHKPHMPWYVPQKYYDMHPLADIQLPPTTENDLSDVPREGVRMAKSPNDDHAAVLASGRWKEAVQAYLATITYLDGQIGRVLDAYDKSPHKNNTIIVLWGDHGWHLGEKEHWRKFTLWEEAARAPFIWVVPGVTKPGGFCKSPVDFMSVYPTLCDLASLPKPAWLEGDNIRPLLADPAAAWTGVGVTTFERNNHAVRTDRWRYIHYAYGGEELYDHSNDEYEWTNLAAKPEHAALKAELAKHFPTINRPPAKGGRMSDNEDEPGGTAEPEKKIDQPNKKGAKAKSPR
jgi:arylsulfatase A-like enzyme